MDIALKIILLGKIKEFARKRVLEQEILKGAKKGLEKLEAALDNFWNDSIEFVKNAQKVDNKYIPNAIEFATEELVLGTIEILKKEMNLRELIEEVLGEEKAAIGI